MGKALQKQFPSGGLPISPSPAIGSSSRVGLKVLLAKALFVAGEQVSGVLEIRVGANDVALGDIGLEFSAFQELRSLDHTSTRRLLSSQVSFQGSSLPPSNAVVPNSLPISGSYYPALRGRTRFAFSFDLPATSPSSCVLGRDAVTRYELRAFASSLVKGEVDIRSEKIEVKVVERWTDWREGRWREGVERKASEKLKLAGEGKLELSASVGMPGEDGVGKGRLFWRREDGRGDEGNGTVEVLVTVKNGSKRSVSGLKLSLCRRLRILNAKGVAPLVTAIVQTDPFRGIGYEFHAGQERSVWVACELPAAAECWNVRRGTLFELDVLLRLDVECGFLAKDLSVELPIFVAHPSSLPAAAHASRPALALPPALPAPPPFPGSQSQSFTYPYQPSPQPLGGSFSEFGAYPATPDPFHRALSTAPLVQSASLQTLPHHSFFAPPPAPSHGPYASGWGQPPPDAVYDPAPAPFYIAFDPHAPEMTQSQFLGQINYQQPQQVFAPPEATMSIALGTPSRPSSRASLYAAPQASQPALSPPPATYQPHADGRSRSPSPDRRQRSPSPDRRSHWDNDALVEHNLQPAEPYSSAMRAEALLAQELHQHPHPRQFTPQPSPVPLQRTHSSTSSLRSMRTPPPPAPSSQSRYISPSPSPSFSAQLSPNDPGLLETIGEDGESQAGTLRSVASLAAALADVPSPAANSPGRNSVQDLEDFVDEEERSREREKALPAPPVPSERTKSDTAKAVPRAQDIFQRSEPENETPPVKLAQRVEEAQPKVALIARTEGGLNKLEALLNRPTTPDLSSLPERIVSPTPATVPFPRSPASRALSPPAPVSALRARSLSRAKSERELKSLIEAEDPRDAVRKAIAAKPDAATSRVRTVSTPAAARVSSSVSTPSLVAGRKVVDIEEANGLRQEAVGRVSTWLQDDATKDDPETRCTAASFKRATIDFVRPAPPPPPSPTKRMLTPSSSPTKRSVPVSASFAPPKPTLKSSAAAPDLASVSSLAKAAPAPASGPLISSRSTSALATALPKITEPSIEELLKAEPKPSTSAGGLALPSNGADGDLFSNYNIKSARGGRGGVVSSVAGLWAEKIDIQRDLTKSPPPLTLVPKALKVGTPAVAPRPLLPVENGRITSSRSLRTMMMDSAPEPVLASKRAVPLVSPVQKRASTTVAPPGGRQNAYEKRWSEPSLAKPFVNTTMGKPPVLSTKAPVAAEVRPVGKVTGGIAALISRYSQEVARP